MTGNVSLALIERVRSEAPPELACLNDHPRYTRRQREVVQLVQGGLTREQAAEKMSVQINTVNGYLNSAKAISAGLKFGAKK